MTFRNEEVENFIALFHQVKQKIRHFEGCQNLDLLRDVKNQNIFFTYSYWESEKHLNNYRTSELFAETWAATKAKFSEKAEAWSVNHFIGTSDNK